MRVAAAALCLLVTSAILAGCSGKGSSAPTDTLAPVSVDANTGGIRGVVVDDAIRPVKGVAVSLPTAHQNTTTGTDGAFTFGKLTPGTYIVRASRPGYDSAQTSVDVVAGVADPKAVRIQLTQLASGQPYMLTTQFNGYIACSAGVPDVGYSEECGAGVGVPCAVPPPAGCQRVGGQNNNLIQNDFHVDSGNIQGIVIEQVWTPTAGSTASGSLYLISATNFVCDPECGWDATLGETTSKSPILLRIDGAKLKALQTDPTTRASTFVWAGADNPNLILDQSFTQYVTFFYGAPPPAGWSFVNGSPNPF